VITVGGFNTSLDKALEVDDLRLGAVNRVREARAYPGGKGLHVALTVAALGEPVRLVGLIDSTHRALFEDHLAARGVEFHGVEASGSVRTCLAIRDADGSRVTEILEPGPELEAGARRELVARFLSLARGGEIAVLSGSVPPGFDDGAYAELVATLAGSGVRCLVDASGGLLRRAVEARPFLVKPNRDEAESLTGEPVADAAAAVRAARALAARGIAVVIVSLGALGAVGVMDGAAWHAAAPVQERASAVGSGDCLLGGVAVGLARALAFEEVLRLGVACGAANTLTAETGHVRLTDVEALRPQVRIESLA
jgi:1-phosphofructokinase family hexose kinase